MLVGKRGQHLFTKQVKKMLLLQQGEYTAKNKKKLILSNRIGLSMCMVVPVLVERISTVNKGLSSQD